jgi:phage-related protein
MQYLVHPAVRRFIDTLSPDLQSRVVEQLALLKKFGRLLPPPDSKKLSRNLFELRVLGRVHIRLLYGFVDDTAFVVHAFVKKSRKIPRRDVGVAHKRLIDLAR